MHRAQPPNSKQPNEKNTIQQKQSGQQNIVNHTEDNNAQTESSKLANEHATVTESTPIEEKISVGNTTDGNG